MSLFEGSQLSGDLQIVGESFIELLLWSCHTIGIDMIACETSIVLLKRRMHLNHLEFSRWTVGSSTHFIGRCPSHDFMKFSICVRRKCYFYVLVRIASGDLQMRHDHHFMVFILYTTCRYGLSSGFRYYSGRDRPRDRQYRHTLLKRLYAALVLKHREIGIEELDLPN